MKTPILFAFALMLSIGLSAQSYTLRQYTFSTGSNPAAAPASASYTLQGSVVGGLSGQEAISTSYRLLPGYYLGTLTVPFPPGLLSLKVFLEGPASPTTPVMNTNLNTSGYLPLSQPYNQAPWNYAGTEAFSTPPAGVVDWVLVELRDAPAPAQATAATIVEGWPKALLLKSDGSITETDGVTLPSLHGLTVENELYVVVRHRNHLGVLSAGALIYADGSYSYDFTQALKMAFAREDKAAYLNGHKLLPNGLYGMFGGDGDGNGQIQTQDKNNIWNPQSGLSGYRAGDFDLNGQVQTQDKNNIWNPNSGIGSSVPQ
ncbi:MAG: hypothetical protein V2I46_12900 [Bacteroides sp.]|jgi:hypothetical protein|nr:hypothetical protein [Bacteroides sp.]